MMMNSNISAINDSQAEATVLATVFKHPEFMNNITYLEPGYFFDVGNGCLYWAVQQLVNEGVTNIDALNLSNVINSNQAVKRKIEQYNIGNIQEFLELSRYSARDTLDEYRLLVNNIVALSFKRELYRRTIDIQKSCLDEKTELKDLTTNMNEVFNNLASKYIIGTDSVTFGEKVRDIWKTICDNRNEDGTVGFPSVIKEFNEYFTYCKKELVLLSAQKKRGKSAFMMNEAIHKSVYNKVPTLYIDTELSDETFTKRVLANLTGIEVKRIEMVDTVMKKLQRLKRQ